MDVETAVTKASNAVNGPIVITPSSVGSQLAAAMRILTVLISGFAALMQLLSARDLAGAYQWVQSTSGAGFIAAVIAVGTFAFSMYTTFRKHQKLVILTANVDNSVAAFKGDTTGGAS